MAIMNFIAGGYYNKLGRTVGQRWRNKRTARAYVIPRNPQTPNQIAWRGQFAKNNVAAQLAMQMNGGAPAFRSSIQSEWALRVQTAARAEKSGAKSLDVVPLAPSNYSAKYVVSSVKYQSYTEADGAVFALGGILPSSARAVSVLFAFPSESGEEYTLSVFPAVFIAGTENTISVVGVEPSQLSENVLVRVVSCDDSNFGNEMLWSPQLSLEMGGVVTRAFNSEMQAAWYDNTGLWVQFAEPWRTMTGAVEVSKMRLLYVDGWEELDYYDAELENVDGYFGLHFEMEDFSGFNRGLCPSGAWVQLPDFLLSSASLVLTHDEENVPFQNAPVESFVSPELDNLASSDLEFLFRVYASAPSSLPAIETEAVLVDNYRLVAAQRSVSARYVYTGGNLKLQVGWNGDGGICLNPTSIEIPDATFSLDGAAWTVRGQTLAAQESALQVSELPVSWFATESEWAQWSDSVVGVELIPASQWQDTEGGWDYDGNFGTITVDGVSYPLNFCEFNFYRDDIALGWGFGWDANQFEWMSEEITLNVVGGAWSDFNLDDKTQSGKRWRLPSFTVTVRP